MIDLSNARIAHVDFGVGMKASNPRSTFNRLLTFLQSNWQRDFIELFKLSRTFLLKSRVEMNDDYIFALAMTAVRQQATQVLEFLTRERVLSRDMIERAYYYAINSNLIESRQVLSSHFHSLVDEDLLETMSEDQAAYIRIYQLQALNCSDINESFDYFLSTNTIDINGFYPLDSSPTGQSPLMLAIQCSNVELAREFLKKGADILHETMDRLYVHPLTSCPYPVSAAVPAMLIGNFELFKDLVDAGAPVTQNAILYYVHVVTQFLNYRTFIHELLRLKISFSGIPETLKSHLQFYIERSAVNHLFATLEMILARQFPKNVLISKVCQIPTVRSAVYPILSRMDLQFSTSHFESGTVEPELIDFLIGCGFSYRGFSEIEVRSALSNFVQDAARAFINRGGNLNKNAYIKLLTDATGLTPLKPPRYDMVKLLLTFKDRYLTNERNDPVRKQFQMVMSWKDQRLQDIYLKSFRGIDRVG